MRVVIVGGVAGGAACAARLRRLSEDLEIVMIEQGPYVSFANCGLPYFLGGEIEDRSKLFVASKELFEQRFNVRVMTDTRVTKIYKDAKKVFWENHKAGLKDGLDYDVLILSPGSTAIVPPFAQGLKNVFTLRNVPDVDAIKARLGEQSCRKVLVAGGGFIGLECAENLKHAGYDVTIIEAATQVLTNLDYDMAQLVHQDLNRNGIRLQLSSPLMGLTQNADGTLCAVANTTENYDAVIMALGGRPDSSIAKEAGLAVDERGFIYVNEYMQTSDESVYALGDAIRLKKVARGRRDRLALAGPANKEARIACTHIINSLYKKSKLAQARCEGFLGASAVKVFDLEAACVGFNERELSNVYKTNFAAIWLHPFNHAGYYPESAQMNLKVIYNPADFTILGAQAVGKEAVKRIEVISAYLGKQGGADDLAAHEQVYAPPFSSARDGVNFAGCVLQNIRDGLVKMARYDELDTKFKEAFLLDVRSPEMFNAKHIPGFVNIPLDKLRERLKEVPQTKPVVVACVVGVSAYIACRILAANGYDVYDLSGGVNTYFAANYKVQ